MIPYFIFFVLSSFDAMSSNRGKMVPGSDDQFVIVWNKQTLHFESEQVCVRIHMSFDLSFPMACPYNTYKF